jgi:hypothetical protein
MIEMLRGRRILEQDEFQWGLVDRKVGISRSLLMGLDPEKTAVISHRFVQVTDIEGEL